MSLPLGQKLDSSGVAELRLTCVHEASHAVLAQKSSFHEVRGKLVVLSVKKASIGIAVSSVKLKEFRNRSGKEPSEKQLAIDEAVILWGGRLGETRLISKQRASGLFAAFDPCGSGEDDREIDKILTKAHIGAVHLTYGRILSWLAVRRHWALIEELGNSMVGLVLAKPGFPIEGGFDEE